MARSLQGTIGAALLAGAALMTQSQQPAPPSATAVQPVSKSFGPIVYPAEQQSASQQSVDAQECYHWAKAQTGIDPQTPAPAAAPAEADGRKARKDKHAHEEQAQSQAQAAQSERTESFRNAVGTCLQGRGYTTG